MKDTWCVVTEGVAVGQRPMFEEKRHPYPTVIRNEVGRSGELHVWYKPDDDRERCDVYAPGAWLFAGWLDA